MRTFDFTVKGLTRDVLRRRRNRTRSQHPHGPKRFWTTLPGGAQIIVWAALAVAGLYVLQWVYNVAGGDNAPSTIVNGQVFTARNVIVLEDTSGSMDGKEVQLNALINQLRAAGIDVRKRWETKGAGFSTQGTDENSLKTLERAVRANPTADTIFVFSDFAMETPVWDFSDEVGYQRLRELLGQGRRRLYLGTVTFPPSQEMLKIARESGGGLFEIKP